MKKNSIVDSYPNLISKYWDYEKNEISPDNINVNSETKYWWKDNTGNFLMSPKELTKKQTGTSFNEQTILYYLKQLFHDVNSRKIINILSHRIEVDIYIPKINLAIEYDGQFWHKNKLEKDIQKGELLLYKKIFLIHVREGDLLPINNNNSFSFMYNYSINDFDYILINIINYIKKYIKDKKCVLSNEEQNRLDNFVLPHKEYLADKINILNQYRIMYIEDNIANSCLIKYWDKEKNIGIIPQKISPKDNIEIWLKCSNGFSKKINILSLNHRHKIRCKNYLNENCNLCNSFYCPMYNYCFSGEKLLSRDFGMDLCDKMKLFYFYNILYNQNYDKFNYYANDIVGKKLDKLNNYDINIYNFYKQYKDELFLKPNSLKIMQKIFPYINLSPKYFDSLNEMDKFLKLYKPYVHKIILTDFDTCNENRLYIINYLKNQRRVDLFEIPVLQQKYISKEFVIMIKDTLTHLFSNKKSLTYRYLIKQYNDILLGRYYKY